MIICALVKYEVHPYCKVLPLLIWKKIVWI